MTVTVALAVAWSALVVVGAMRWRPAPGRVRQIASRRGTATSEAPPPGLPTRLGSAVLRRLGRDHTPLAARRMGLALLGGAAGLPLSPVAAAALAALGWGLPGLEAAREDSRRLAAVEADLPETVDLLALAVGAGLNVHLAVAAVAQRGSGPLAAELGRAVREVSVGRRLGDALDDIPARAGEAVRPLVSALVASERYGVPLSASLERLAADVRAGRRRRAEEAARKVPVKLLFPLVTCTLPAFALLTVAPLIASAMRSLRL